MTLHRTWLLDTVFFGLAALVSWQARGKPVRGRLNNLQHATLAMFHVCLSVSSSRGPCDCTHGLVVLPGILSMSLATSSCKTWLAKGGWSAARTLSPDRAAGRRCGGSLLHFCSISLAYALRLCIALVVSGTAARLVGRPANAMNPSS